MPVETEADRASFLNPEEFGEIITWSGGPAEGISGIPDTGTLQLEGQDGPGMLNRHATILCSVADIGFALGGEVSFRAAEHTVKSIEPDGTGMALVRLELVVED